MKRIVVTGALGGTGRSIVQVLRDAGHEVVPVDFKPTSSADCGYKYIDLRDGAGVNDVFAGADGVVHFGSVPGDAHLSTSAAFHNVAVAGFNVFQAARNCRIDRVVWASSIEVYGDLTTHPQLPVTEDAPVAPPGMYGACKLVLESLARDFARWHGMAIAGLRLSRIIYDNDFGRAKLKRISSAPEPGADCLWSYVDARDVARACQAWLDAEHQGAEVFNVAAPDMHLDAPVTELLPRFGYGQARLARAFADDETPFSARKLRTMLDWEIRHDWRQILGET